MELDNGQEECQFINGGPCTCDWVDWDGTLRTHGMDEALDVVADAVREAASGYYQQTDPRLAAHLAIDALRALPVGERMEAMGMVATSVPTTPHRHLIAWTEPDTSDVDAHL